MMDLSLPVQELERYVRRLVANHLPDDYSPLDSARSRFGRALERVEYSFSRIRRRYYRETETVRFDHLNGDHMAALLYFYGNTIWREDGDVEFPTRLFYVNKILHGLDLFYSVPMPDVFLLVHPVGTVLGKATYGDYLVVYQNCTVGADTDVYPTFGEGTILYSRSSVLGDCRCGDNVVFAANSLVVNLHVPSDTVVVGQYPNHRFVPNRQSVRERCFDSRLAAGGGNTK
jgi:serine O-acetyltransferase